MKQIFSTLVIILLFSVGAYSQVTTKEVIKVATDITGASTCVVGKIYYNATSLVNWERNNAGVCAPITSGGTPGNVVGPASAVDNHLAVFDGTTGKIIKDGGAIPTATPAGSDTQVQFNDSSAFGGDAGLVYNKTTDVLTNGGKVISPVFQSNGTSGNGFFEGANQSSAPGTPTTAGRLFWDALNRLSWKGANGFVRTFDGTANSADRVYTLQNRNGTIADDTDLAAKQNTITFGTGVQTALGINVGSAGAPVLLNGAGGTPSSLALANATATTQSQGDNSTKPATTAYADTLGATKVTGPSSATNLGIALFDGTTGKLLSSPAGVTVSAGVELDATSFRAGASGYFYFLGRSLIDSSGDGKLRIANNGATDFSLLQFGGLTASFPALKRSGTGLIVRLADDSADAPLQAGATTLTSVNKVTITAPATSATITVQDGKTLSYEEGTWTPTRNGFTEVIGGGSITNTGKYVKIGNVVTATCLLQPAGGATIAGVAGNGSFISGLPYAATAPYGGGTYGNANATPGGTVLTTGTNIFVTTAFPATTAGVSFVVQYVIF